jgi:LysR family nitrogen assimilation transcriptional regulator
MDLNAIEYFYAVTQAGSLSKAASDLGVEQSTLTRQIDRLEKFVGVKLFHRSGRGMILNDKGKVFYQYAEEVMSAASKARVAASELASDGPAQIIIAAQPTIAQVTFGSIGHALKDEFPRSTIRFSEGLGHQTVSWLLEGEVDAAVLYLPERSSIIDYDILLTEPLYCVSPYSASQRDSITAAELLDLPLVLPSTAYGVRAIIQTFSAKTGKSPNISIEVDGSNLLTRNLVQMHHGHAIMPLASVSFEIAQKMLSATRIDDQDAIRTVVLATAKGRPAVSGLSRITQLVKLTIARLVENNEWPGVNRML